MGKNQVGVVFSEQSVDILKKMLLEMICPSNWPLQNKKQRQQTKTISYGNCLFHHCFQSQERVIIIQSEPCCEGYDTSHNQLNVQARLTSCLVQETCLEMKISNLLKIKRSTTSEFIQIYYH